MSSGSAEQRALALVRTVAATVPAYRAFLDERGVDPERVRTFDDFRALPLLTKDNYLRRYPLQQLCRERRADQLRHDRGVLGIDRRADLLAAVDGRRAAPSPTRFEQVFQDSFGADLRRTLAVVCFALGTWVGGMYTASCCRHLAARGYPITVITPGNNNEEILRVVTALGPQFEQVVLLGYPPFLKDVIDSGRARGRRRGRTTRSSWCWPARCSARSGARWSPPGRAAPLRSDPCYDSASLYGTADAGRAGQRDAALDLYPAVPCRARRTPRASCSVRRGCRRWRSTTRAAGCSRCTRARCCSRATTASR